MKNKTLLPLEFNRNAIRSIIPSMRFHNGDDYSQWCEQAREKLCELLCCPSEKVEPLMNVEYDIEKPEWREIRFHFQSEPDYFIPCYLLIPHDISVPNATVICLQGHSTGMHFSVGKPLKANDEELIVAYDKDFAVQAVKHGYCALALEQRCFGECGGKPQPDCNDASLVALLCGRTTIGQRVWDVSRAIDVIIKYYSDIVDSSRIYCTGNSGGGTTTFYAACIDKRISAAMPSCAVCTYKDSIGAVHHCTCNYIPHIAEYFDMGDLIGLIAPSALVIVSGKNDSIFPLHGAQICVESAISFYNHLGIPKKFEWVIGKEGHRFYADICWDALKRVTE